MSSSCCGIVVIIVTILLLRLFGFLLDLATGEYIAPSYKDCAPSICGNSTIRYPFGKCGAGSADCLDNRTLQITFQDNLEFRARVIGNITESSYYTRTLQIAQDIHFGHSSVLGDDNVFDTSDSVFNLSEGYIEGTILNCTQQKQDINENLTRLDWGETDHYLFFYNGSSSHLCGFSPLFCNDCSTRYLVVPTDKKYNISGDKNLEQLKQRGFQITWTIPDSCLSCNATGGRCYYNHTYNYNSYSGYHCICRHGFYRSKCSEGHPAAYVLSVGLTAEMFLGSCALFSIVVVSCIVVRRQSCCTRTATEEQSIRAFMDPVDPRTPSVENFLNYYSSQVPTRYSYAQIKTYTNNLAETLGKGGFGTVYKGQLPTGRGIAVKILDKSKQSEQQFITEVATVGTTCHVNLVRLLGYCSQASIKALVYEYMENGSLERYIHGGRHDELDWKQLYSIALGTARGLAYLHDECRNRILHFDIKPHNVLLDANFLPKVADFGLAKIADREESHVSVARLYGVVTDRSDVYSYGMLLMEMVGARQNIDFHNKESRSSQFFYTE